MQDATKRIQSQVNIPETKQELQHLWATKKLEDYRVTTKLVVFGLFRMLLFTLNYTTHLHRLFFWSSSTYCCWFFLCTKVQVRCCCCCIAAHQQNQKRQRCFSLLILVAFYVEGLFSHLPGRKGTWNFMPKIQFNDSEITQDKDNSVGMMEG